MEINMNIARSTALAKQLVQVVARAFYTDNIVVLLDALVREKYIKFEEIAPRLHMSAKDVKGMIEILEVKECLIKSQCLTVDGANWKLYYIDYQSFTNIIRYRVHLMQQALIKREAELNSMLFECPSCHTRFSSLEAQKLLTKDMKRACPHCCPSDEISKIVSGASFRLFEVNIKNTNTDVMSMQQKFKEQLSESDDHEGIFELLAKLKDVPLLRNTPKDNIDHGLYTSVVTDTDTKKEIEDSIKGKTKIIRPGSNTNNQSEQSTQLNIEIVSHSSSLQSYENEQSIKKPKTVPDFLLESGVKNGNTVMLQAMEMQNSRGQIEVQSLKTVQEGSPESKIENTSDDIAWE